MSARLPSRWLFAVALLAALGLTSAAPAQTPTLPGGAKSNGVPQTAPEPVPFPPVPFRVLPEPLLLEEEQVSEHGAPPRRTAPPVLPSAPRVLRGCGLPDCDRDDERMSADEVRLRCLLFTLNPLAAFLPLQVEEPDAPSQTPEQVGMPEEVERITLMPDEVEELDVMPDEESSEPQYQLLGPWIDSARLFNLPAWPLAEIQVGVTEERTGSLLFGVGVEVSRTGTVTVNAEPMPEPKVEPISVHDLLRRCQRELSRGHYAAAEDLAQQALQRDRRQVFADPTVCGTDLLRRLKDTALLPLGTVDPCEAKSAGRATVPAGEGKAIGSNERMAEALLQEFNVAFREARYRDAAALAERALRLDPANGAAAAALRVAAMQQALRSVPSVPDEPPVRLLAAARDHLQQGRYEEARNAALQVLSAAPDNQIALAILQRAVEALSRLPRPESIPQCTYVGTNVRPALPAIDPAVVSALQKLLIDGEKAGPFGGTEEAEPKEGPDKPAPRR